MTPAATRSDGGATTGYFYDDENRLIFVQSDGRLIEYAYDAEGRRTRSNVNGAVTGYLIDSNRDFARVLEERNDAGTLTASYIYGDDLIRQERDDVSSFYHYDGLGSTRVLTDKNENVTDTYTYKAFGNLIHSTGSTENVYLFAGEQFDSDAELYYLRARYYDPGNGRFLTTDPRQGRESEPVTLHRYQYAANNPVTHIDPSGQFFMMIDIGMANSIRNILSGVQADVGMALFSQAKDGGDAGFEDLAVSAVLNVGGVVAAPVIKKMAKRIWRYITSGVKWTSHGGKHVAKAGIPWKKIVESTKSGPAKYLPGTDIESLERMVWSEGKKATNGKSWKVIEFPDEIGASGGKSSRWMRVEESGGTIHGHPISKEEYEKITR